MWLFTTFGFFSIVRKPADTHQLTIRARTRGDLLRLRQGYLPELSEPVHGAGTDYPWRGTCSPQAWAEALPRIAAQIDYPNFKDAVHKRLGAERAHRYAKVWQAMYDLDDDPPEKPAASDPADRLAPAYGGVVVDAQGRILLREVAGHFDGYVWTFAKGRPDPGESAEAAALREVAEEMGVQAQVLRPIPGWFAGGTTRNHYFLMRAPAQVDLGHHCRETARLCWASPQQARELIGQTGNTAGRARDLAVLSAALALLPDALAG